jgi:hypothetical protein
MCSMLSCKSCTQCCILLTAMKCNDYAGCVVSLVNGLMVQVGLVRLASLLMPAGEPSVAARTSYLAEHTAGLGPAATTTSATASATATATVHTTPTTDIAAATATAGGDGGTNSTSSDRNGEGSGSDISRGSVLTCSGLPALPNRQVLLDNMQEVLDLLHYTTAHSRTSHACLTQPAVSYLTQ